MPEEESRTVYRHRRRVWRCPNSLATAAAVVAAVAVAGHAGTRSRPRRRGCWRSGRRRRDRMIGIGGRRIDGVGEEAWPVSPFRLAVGSI